MKINTTVILAGGKSERFRASLGFNLPKQLHPFNGPLPLLVHSIMTAPTYNVIVGLRYKGKFIEESCKLYSNLFADKNVQFFIEPEEGPAGTGAGLLYCLTLLDKPQQFLCLMGDHYFEPGMFNYLLRKYEYIHTSIAFVQKTRVASTPFEKRQRPLVVTSGDLDVLGIVTNRLDQHHLGTQAACWPETGAYIFNSDSIYAAGKEIVHSTGECDLIDAVGLQATKMKGSVKAIDIWPWSYVNINTVIDLAYAENYYCKRD